MSRSNKMKFRSLLLSSTAGSVALAAGLLGAAGPAHADFDRFVLIQPIQVCDDSGANCAGVQYFHVATAATYEQANVLPIFLPLSQFNNTALLNSNDGPGDFSDSDGGSSDAQTINMWFTARNSIVDCGGPGTSIVGCAFRPGRRAVIDGDFAVGQAGNISVHDGTHSNLIAHEMGHNFGLPHVGDGSTLTNRLMNPFVRTDNLANIGVSNFLLSQNEIDTIRADSKAQAAIDCVGTGGADAISLAAGDACLNIFGQAGNDAVTLNAGSGVLQDIVGGSGDDLVSVLNGSIVGGSIFGGSGQDAIHIGGIVMNDVFGGSGNDFIDLLSTGVVVGNVDGGSGDDMLVIAADPDDVLGGTGNDLIVLNTGAAVNNVYGDDNDGNESDDGADFIIMNDGTVFGDVDGEGADDVIRILGGTIDGDVLGGGGDDVIETAAPARIGGIVDGEAGNDAITIASIDIDFVAGGTGDDVITLNSGALVSAVWGDDIDADESDDGNDIINIAGGTVAGNVRGEGGNDVINLSSGSVFRLFGGGGDDLFNLDGGTVNIDVHGESGDDVFSLTGALVVGDVFGEAGADLYHLTGGSVIGSFFAGSGADLIVIDGGTVGGNVDGEGDDDVITLTGGSVGNSVLGGGGDDVLTLAGGSVGLSVLGQAGDDEILNSGSAIAGNIDGGEGADIIIQAGGFVTTIIGGLDDDLIQVIGGTVFGSVLGQDGDDVIVTAEPGTVAGNVDGGADDDWITIASDPANVLGGTGDDVIDIVTGAVVTGSVYGDDNDGSDLDDGNDVINLTGGSVAGSVLGEGGDDIITLAGTTVAGSINGNGGVDTLIVTGGSAFNVLGGADNDTGIWTGGTIANLVDMGTGSDTLDIYGVNAGGSALQAGLSALDGGDDASIADGDTDVLNLHGVVEVLTDLANWEFINLVDTSRGDLGQTDRLIVTEQFFIEAGSVLIATGNFGSTQSYVIDGNLVNEGVLDMQDGAPSYDEFGVTGTYWGGPGSTFRTDTFLGGVGSPSDLMIVGTATAGETALFVFDTNAGPGAYNPVGIPIVDVSAGTTDESHFLLVDGFTGLAGPIDKGLFFYDLALRPDNVHVLIGVPDLEAFQLGRVPGQAQTAWHSTTGVWLDRTADLRAYLDGSAAPGTRGAVSPGFWLRGVGSFLDRDDRLTFTLFNKSYDYNTSYDQNTYGAFAGGDWAWSNVFGEGDSGVLGAFVGYTGWDARFDQQSAGGGHSTVEAGGVAFGLYTTYLNRGFFLDGVFKADFPEVDLSFPGLEPVGPSSGTVDARALGGVLDMGYRHKFGFNWYVEGLGTLSYVDTEIDPIDLAGSVVEFGDDQSFRGRLGLGIGGTYSAGEVLTLVHRLSLSVWQEFDGRNGTDIFSPMGAPLDIRDDLSGTYGEVSALVDIFSNQSGLSVFIKSDYRFGEDTSEFTGTMGLRYQ